MKPTLGFTGASQPALVGALAVAALAFSPQIASADESGISFWVPGLFGSLAEVPTTPGWSLGAVYYHTSGCGHPDGKHIGLRRAGIPG